MIYVDNAKNSFNRMVMSHLSADTTEELLNFAIRDLGLKGEWIQNRGTWKEHFDVSKSKRDVAVKKGAVSMNSHDYVQLMKLSKKQLSERECRFLLDYFQNKFSNDDVNINIKIDSLIRIKILPRL